MNLEVHSQIDYASNFTIIDTFLHYSIYTL